jgi:hypothetical protein
MSAAAALAVLAAAAAVSEKRVWEKVVVVDALEMLAAVVVETGARPRSQPQRRWAPDLQYPEHCHHQ